LTRNNHRFIPALDAHHWKNSRRSIFPKKPDRSVQNRIIAFLRFTEPEWGKPGGRMCAV
jgi:hypothetical protein